MDLGYPCTAESKPKHRYPPAEQPWMDPRNDREGGGIRSKCNFKKCAKYQIYFIKPGDLVLDPTRPPRLKAKPMAGRWQAAPLSLMCVLFLNENVNPLILQRGIIDRKSNITIGTPWMGIGP